MSKELPYFKFYPSEWLLQRIADENYRVKGIFIECCAIYWQRNCVINRQELDRKLGKTQVKVMLDKEFIYEDNDRIFIEFLDEQYSELLEIHHKRVNAGRKGGKAKAEQSHSNAKAKPKQVDKEEEEDKEEEKKNIYIPSLDEFLDYTKEVCNENGLDYEGLLFSIKAKYDSWVEAKWKDGHGKKIKNWKTKFRSTLPHLKPIHNGTATQPDWFVRATANRD